MLGRPMHEARRHGRALGAPRCATVPFRETLPIVSDTPDDAKRATLTLHDDDVVVRRDARARAVAQIGGALGASAKLATDPLRAPQPQAGGSASDADAA